ncbi:MAG: hypothetical protein IJ071_11725 [Ruminococcus sp.]|nr:hypothetical protein [Ruminococcus sp.]
MKLNYREKVILGAVLAFIIILAGIFGLIKPKAQDIKDDKAALAAKQEEKEEVEKKIAEIEPLKKDIDNIYKETNDMVDDFVEYNDIYTPELLDQYMQEYAQECNVEVSTLNVGSLANGNMEYYFFTPTTLSEELFTSADVNGDQQTLREKKEAESTSLNQREKAQAMVAQYGISAKGKKEDIWAYMDAIKDIDDAVIINTVSISDYTFGEDLSDEEKAALGDDEGKTDVQFVISLYSVYDMAKPNTDAD